MAALRPQSSSCSLNGCQPGCRAADVTVSDQFPAGLRVLIVDDDPTCLRILSQMLRRCMYEGDSFITCLVYTCNFANYLNICDSPDK